MKRLTHDPEQFDVLGLIDAIGARYDISINRTDEILRIIKASASKKPPSTMLHGRRVEAMFGYVAAALGKCSLIATLLPDPGGARERQAVYRRMAGEVVETVEDERVGGRTVAWRRRETRGGILHWKREGGPDAE